MARTANVQRLIGCLYTLRYCYIPICRFARHSVPLLPPDADVPLALGEVLAQVYQRAAYARRIDYTLAVPPPPLRPAMQRWLAAHLAP